jgi:cell division protein FtsZ
MPKKRGGFNILGINIGGTSELPRQPQARVSSPASNLRLPLESPLASEPGEPRVLPNSSKPKVAAEEVRTALTGDDQLEIPAFLRRQAN